MCGGGGSSQPSQQTVTQVTIPPELMPYAKKALGTAEDLVYNKPYETYGYQRFAGINPLQQQALEQVQQQQTAPQTQQATGFAGLAGVQAQQLGTYSPSQYQGVDVDYVNAQAPQVQQFEMGAPERVSGPTEFDAVSAPSLSNIQMAGPQQVQTERFGLSSLQPYMSPYMQSVVERQKKGAVQDYMRQLPGIGASAARMGARGGTREALLQSEARRNLSERLGDIEAQGLQQAYQQGAQQFGADRAALMQAALANQAAGLTSGQANLQAALQTQGLGAQQGLQAQLANQQAGITGAQMGLQAQLANQQAMQRAAEQNLAARLGVQQFGAQQGLQAQLANQQAQLQAQQQALGQRQFGAEFGERSRQFGANLGLQGIQQQLAAAGMLGQLGQQQFGQEQAINESQMRAGAGLQQMEQQRLQAAYEDFLNRQRYPYQQLGFMSDLIRGTPTAGGIQSIYGAQTSPLGAIAGLGGLYMANRAS